MATRCTDDQGCLVFAPKSHPVDPASVPRPCCCLSAVASPPRMRADSKAANSSKSMEIMDVNPQAVLTTGAASQWLIHWPYPSPGGPPNCSATANPHGVWYLARHSEGSMVKVTPDDVNQSTFRSNSCASTIPAPLPGRRCALPPPCMLVFHNVTQGTSMSRKSGVSR